MRLLTFTLVLFLLPAGSLGAANTDKLSMSGDLRLRIESDWDSARSNGTKRDDRTRARIRARFGVACEASKRVSFVARLRTGSNESQQSPHITIADFDGNSKGDTDLNLDTWYVQYQTDNAGIWLGRKNLPFWRPNEMVLDDDVTPAGIGVEYSFGDLTINASHAKLPAGMQNFTGNVSATQAIYERQAGATKLKIAGGVMRLNADRNDSSNNLLLDNNASRDYLIWVANLQLQKTFLDRPLRLNFDMIRNTKSYGVGGNDTIASFNRDERNGYVISTRLGDANKRNGWQLGYTFSHIEALAVNNSYAQDDWLRWGNATQTRASNFRGSEFRAVWGFSSNLQLVARLYIVQGIRDRNPSSLNKEDGKRFRVDLNWRF